MCSSVCKTMQRHIYICLHQAARDSTPFTCKMWPLNFGTVFIIVSSFAISKVACMMQEIDVTAASITKLDPSPCTLAWPKFGDVYPVDDIVNFMFFCKLSESFAQKLTEEQGKIRIEWAVFQYNDRTYDFEFLQSMSEYVYVRFQSGTIALDFKFNIFQKAVGSEFSSMKFSMRVFVADSFVDSMSTMIVPGSDAFFAKMTGESAMTVYCAYAQPGHECQEPVSEMRHLDFIEIGTSGFDTLLEAAPEHLVGLSIEPLKHLQDTLPDRKNVVKISCAIGDKPGWKDIYYMPSHYMEYNNFGLKSESAGQFLYGLGRVGEIRPDMVAQLGYSGFLHPYLLHVMRTLVPVRTVAQIYSKHAVSGVTLLKLDCEGFDYRIMQTAYDFFLAYQVKLPLLVEFENNSDHRAAAAVVERLVNLGYLVYSFFYSVTRVVHDSTVDAPHGVIYAEMSPALRSTQDDVRINAVKSIIPKDILVGRKLCAEYHGEKSIGSTAASSFCSILMSKEDTVLSVSGEFRTL